MEINQGDTLSQVRLQGLVPVMGTSTNRKV